MERAIGAVLAEKSRGAGTVTVEPDATVTAAVRRMNEQRIGSLLVMEGDRLVGIFTERDVLVRVIAGPYDPDTTPVREVMTRKVMTVTRDTSVGAAMQLMTNNRWRHLPIVDDGKVIGVVSIGDLTWWLVRDQRLLIDDLVRYISS